MSEPTNATLSVRGEARMTVPPDFGVFHGVVTASGDTKAAALGLAAAGLRQLTGALSSLGGVPLDATAPTPLLGWSAYSATTEVEHEFDERTGRHRLTGHVVASAAVRLVLRDFAFLERLGAALAGVDGFHVHSAQWGVDANNPSWPQVRASAIRAAIAQGRDYAAALGGSLRRVEQIADVGLLGGGGPARTARFAAAATAAAGAPPDVPSLDPVPQELVATIEARFIADVPAL